MDKFKTFINKFRKSKSFVNEQTVKYLSDRTVGEMVAQLNREQMAKGEDSERNDLGEYGEWRTEQREERGLQTDYIDLKFEGNFYESIYGEGVFVNNKPALNVNTTSPEDWDAIAEDSRFKKALGLNEENRNKIGNMIALHLQKELLKYYKV